jgi:hypothetical protein
MKTYRLMPLRETVGIDFENHSNNVYYVTGITCSSSQPFLILVTYQWRRDLEELIVAQLVIKILCHVTRVVVAVFTGAV